jgi:hypothetical protein
MNYSNDPSDVRVEKACPVFNCSHSSLYKILYSTMKFTYKGRPSIDGRALYAKEVERRQILWKVTQDDMGTILQLLLRTDGHSWHVEWKSALALAMPPFPKPKVRLRL